MTWVVGERSGGMWLRLHEKELENKTEGKNRVRERVKLRVTARERHQSVAAGVRMRVKRVHGPLGVSEEYTVSRENAQVHANASGSFSGGFGFLRLSTVLRTRSGGPPAGGLAPARLTHTPVG